MRRRFRELRFSGIASDRAGVGGHDCGRDDFVRLSFVVPSPLQSCDAITVTNYHDLPNPTYTLIDGLARDVALFVGYSQKRFQRTTHRTRFRLRRPRII